MDSLVREESHLQTVSLGLLAKHTTGMARVQARELTAAAAVKCRQASFGLATALGIEQVLAVIVSLAVMESFLDSVRSHQRCFHDLT